MSTDRRYSLRDLIEKVREYMDLEEELNERRARDYVTRVLLERPGQGARTPYTDEVLYKLLFLLRVRQQAPKLELLDIGRIIRSLPPEVVERVGKGDEELDLPRLPDADVYARHLLGEGLHKGEDLHVGMKVRHIDDFQLQVETVPLEESSVRQPTLPLTTQRPDDWTTVPTARGIRLQIKGDLTVAQQRQLEHVAKLIDELVGRR